eukprot:jgi/Botrbrau1/13286/Bobra.27_2s0006.1
MRRWARAGSRGANPNLMEDGLLQLGVVLLTPGGAQGAERVGQYLPYSFGSLRTPWSQQDDSQLQEAVLHQVRSTVVNSILDKKSEGLGSVSQLVSLEQQLQEAVQSLEADSAGVDEIVQAFTQEQWAAIPTLAGLAKTGDACRARWLFGLRRPPADEEWTVDQDERLQAAVEKHGLHQWDEVAKEVGGGRLETSCLMRWQRNFNPAICKRVWLPSEDRRLRAAVQQHGRNWTAVAACLGERTAQQAMHRWRFVVGAGIKKGKWTDEEDQTLLQAVDEVGKKWSVVALRVDGRTDMSCRERYMNVLDPSLRKGPWSLEEDWRLQETVEAFKRIFPRISWAGVSRRLPGRTDSMCTEKISAQPGWQEAWDRELAAAGQLQDLGDRPAPSHPQVPGEEGGVLHEAPSSVQDPDIDTLPAQADMELQGGSPGVLTGQASLAGNPSQLLCEVPGVAARGTGGARGVPRAGVSGDDGTWLEREPHGGPASTTGLGSRKRAPSRAPTALDALAFAAELVEDGRVVDEETTKEVVEEEKHGDKGGEEVGEAEGEEEKKDKAVVRKVRTKLTCPECGRWYRQGDLVRHKNSKGHKVALLDQGGYLLSVPP